MSLYNNILETIGKTPLVRLSKIEKVYNLDVKLFAKLESFNPGNNVKTRPAFYMIKNMYEQKIMDKDSKIVEASSGNTGIGLALVGAYYGNEVIIVMPENVSKERIDVLRHYGATVLLTDKEEGILGSEAKVKEMLANDKKAVQPSQFKNINNPLSHYEMTAREIDVDLSGKIDYIFITIGTGGTVSGIGKYFKEHGRKTKIIGIEPESAPVISKGVNGNHKIQGIGPGFVPEILDLQVVDEIITISDEAAWEMTKLIPRIEGISAGISSGAALASALKYLNDQQLKQKNIVIIFPDSGEKYFSTTVFD